MKLEKILNNVIEMQDSLFKMLRPEDREFIQKEEQEVADIVALVCIDGEDGGEFKITLDEQGFIRYAPDNYEPVHTIRLHEDTFLDLLSGESDFQKAYMRGEISFEGRNKTYHALKIGRGFKRLSHLLKVVQNYV